MNAGRINIVPALREAHQMAHQAMILAMDAAKKTKALAGLIEAEQVEERKKQGDSPVTNP